MKYMTVKKLRKLLKKHPGDMIVMLARDLEGNGFSPMDKRYPISFGLWKHREFWSDEEFQEYNEDAKKAIVLWPMY